MLTLLANLFIIFALYIIIGFIWAVSEIIWHGKVIARKRDDFIAVALALVIFWLMR